LSPECPDNNNIKKDKWHITKATQYYVIRLTIIKMNNKKKVTMKASRAQQAKPHPELDGVA
jgi:hypothetical protein